MSPTEVLLTVAGIIGGVVIGSLLAAWILDRWF